MAKVSFTKLNAKVNDATNVVDFSEGVSIEVKQYLPIKDKYDLVMTTLQQCNENGFYNPIKLTMYFLLNICFMYSNISFTEKQRESTEKLFDQLYCSGVTKKVLDAIPEAEYNQLYEWLFKAAETAMQRDSSVAAWLSSLISDLPEKMDSAVQSLSKLDSRTFENAFNFVQAINNGKPLK